MSEPPAQYPAYPQYPGDGGGEVPADPYATYRRPDVAPHGRPQPLGATTTVTIVASAGLLGLVLVQAVLVWFAQAQWLEAEEQGRSALEFLTPYEVVNGFWVLFMVLAYVATCVWLYRVRSNVDVLVPHALHARRRGWVWAGWIVPVVSLWFPFQVVRDVLRPRMRPGVPMQLVGWWWATFLIAFFLTQVETRLVPWEEIDTDVVGLIGPVNAAATAMFVVSFALWMRVVRVVALDQRLLLAEAGIRG